MRARRLAVVTVLGSLCAAAALGVSAFAPGAAVEAQEGPTLSPRLEAQALQVERQLLCPQCTNKRLDVCELAICRDMKQLIRERLADGDQSDDILLFFSTRYGDRVLARLPKSGFNLWLWGWVGGSLAAMALLGGGWLLRRRPPPSGAAPGFLEEAPPDEAWLDEQLRDDELSQTPPHDAAARRR